MATDNIARGLAGSKLSKKGGTVDGNLEITGNLNVRGTTVTTRQETLFIKDNMIVTNADGKTLQGVSGIAIRSGSSVVYGLVYDPTSDTVKFGMGSLDSSNNFTFNTNEGLPIAVRADSSLFVDGHFVKWDATNYCFVDGGSVADIPNQKPFNPNWTTSSFTALIASVYADTNVAAGDVYIGAVYGGTTGGMPFDGNAEVRIEINTANRGVMHCEITSSNVAPYHWECQVVNGTINPWRSWFTLNTDNTSDGTITLTKESNGYKPTLYLAGGQIIVSAKKATSEGSPVVQIFKVGNLGGGRSYTLFDFWNKGLAGVGLEDVNNMYGRFVPAKNSAEASIPLDIGDSVRLFRNIYLSGFVSDGNNANYGLVLPNTTSYTSNETIATISDINSAIVSALNTPV